MKRDKKIPNDWVGQTRKGMEDLLNIPIKVGREFLIKDGKSDKSGTISLPLHRQEIDHTILSLISDASKA